MVDCPLTGINIIHRIAIHLLCGVCLAAVLLLAFQAPLYEPYQEGTEYAAMANGDGSHLHSYYAGRVLHPWTVRALAQILHRTPDAAVFRMMSEISLIVIFAALSVYYAIEGCSWVLLFFAATPILIDQYRNYYWADLFYLAVWLVFLLLLRWNKWLSLPMVLALYLTRESTIMLVVSLFIVGALQGKRLFAAGSIVTGLAGASLVSLRVSDALPNTHGISVWMLDLLKIPFNFALNILGISLWTNTIAATNLPPVRSFNLPNFLQVGNIVQVGYIDWSWARPAALALFLMAAFGALLAIVFRRIRLGSMGNERTDLAVSRIFGSLMLLLTPLAGTTPARYILYAAPLFWIAGAERMKNWSWQQILPLAGLSSAIAWFPVFVRLIGDRGYIFSISLLPTKPAELLVSLALPLLGWHALSGRIDANSQTSNDAVCQTSDGGN